MTNFLKGIFFLVGLLLLLIVVVDISLWIVISADASKSFEQIKADYYKLLPALFSKRFVLELFNISILTVAAYLFYRSRNANFLRVLSMLFLIICFVLLIWMLFTLL